MVLRGGVEEVEVEEDEEEDAYTYISIFFFILLMKWVLNNEMIIFSLLKLTLLWDKLFLEN